MHTTRVHHMRRLVPIFRGALAASRVIG